MSAPVAQHHLHAVEQLVRAFAQTPDPARDQRLALFLEQVAAWNRKINLTAAREPRALAEVMLADAFALAQLPGLAAGARVLDVGTGAGAPLVPLLLLRPDLSALCIEPLQKRCTFLRMLSVRLELLERMRVQQGRIDLAQPSVPDTFDVATSRATFAPEVWLGAGLALAERVLVMTAGGEPPAAPPAVTLEAQSSYELPFSRAPRSVFVYRRG